MKSNLFQYFESCFECSSVDIEIISQTPIEDPKSVKIGVICNSCGEYWEDFVEDGE